MLLLHSTTLVVGHMMGLAIWIPSASLLDDAAPQSRRPWGMWPPCCLPCAFVRCVWCVSELGSYTKSNKIITRQTPESFLAALSRL